MSTRQICASIVRTFVVVVDLIAAMDSVMATVAKQSSPSNTVWPEHGHLPLSACSLVCEAILKVELLLVTRKTGFVDFVRKNSSPRRF